MKNLQVKVCGITRAQDAELACRLGADYLGFIFFEKSPRALSIKDFPALSSRCPADARKVYVNVTPEDDELAWALDAGFSFFQLHFPEDYPLERIASWSRRLTPEKLWLAPKRPPGKALNPALLPLAHTFVLDTWRPGVYGGTGQTGDWDAFSTLQQEHPEKYWILAGGLNAENITSALDVTGARWVDVNSGIETSPGQKDEKKLKAFFAALKKK